MTAIASELVVEIADFGIAVAVCAAFVVMRAQFAPGAIRPGEIVGEIGHADLGLARPMPIVPTNKNSRAAAVAAT
ncbi:hypothetical protein NKH63_30740 [Mesorhizobium sp. M0960]|uniref:hypothetical protein n=1 Tax=Mesorhizobium sp. M0960 TaxID=2957035 RepID=UPI003338F75B